MFARRWMSPRLLALLVTTWGLAVACSTNDDGASPPLEEAGGAAADAGAPSAEAGGGMGEGAAGASSGVGGSGGSAGGSGGSSAAAGSGTAPGGSAGEPAAGGVGPAGGAPTTPGLPSSPTCGRGKFQTTSGCAVCPALPSSHPPAVFGCASVAVTEKFDEDLSLQLDGLGLHEPLSGEVSVGWSDVNQVSPDGQADVPFEYSPASGKFFLDLPPDARYADHWNLEEWTFTDACGFVFTTPALTIDYSGAVYSCHDPD